jgi:hypothetical protein
MPCAGDALPRELVREVASPSLIEGEAHVDEGHQCTFAIVFGILRKMRLQMSCASSPDSSTASLMGITRTFTWFCRARRSPAMMQAPK